MSDHAITTVPLPLPRYVADPNDVECCVCLSPHYEPIRAEPCGHVACHNCLDRLDQCPSCRAHVHSTTPCDEAYTTKCHNTQVSCLSCPWTGTRKQQVTQAHVMCPALCKLQAEEKMISVMRDVYPKAEFKRSTILNILCALPTTPTTRYWDRHGKEVFIDNTYFVHQMIRRYCPSLVMASSPHQNLLSAEEQIRLMDARELRLANHSIIAKWSTTRHTALQSLSGSASCLLWTLLDACSSNNTELAVGLALRVLAIPPSSPDAFPAGLEWQYVCLLVAMKSNHATLRELLRNGFTVPNPLPEAEHSHVKMLIEYAVKSKDFECLRLLFQRCRFVQFKWTSFDVMIIISMRMHYRHGWITRLVVEAEVNVNDPHIKDGFKVYPLFLATKIDNANLVSELLRNGAYLDHRSGKFANTALHVAVLHTSTECLDALLIAGANTDIKNRKGETPLYLAASAANLDHITSLVAVGADANVAVTTPHAKDIAVPWMGSRTIVDDTPLCRAAAVGNLAMVKYLHGLLTKPDGNNNTTTTSSSHQNAIAVALMSNNVDIVEYLIEKGYHITLDVLCLAIGRRELITVKLFLDHAADPRNAFQFGSMDGAKAMHLAVKSNHVDMMKLLFKYGADLTPDLEHEASNEGYLDSVNYLRTFLRDQQQ